MQLFAAVGITALLSSSVLAVPQNQPSEERAKVSVLVLHCVGRGSNKSLLASQTLVGWFPFGSSMGMGQL